MKVYLERIYTAVVEKMDRMLERRWFSWVLLIISILPYLVVFFTTRNTRDKVMEPINYEWVILMGVASAVLFFAKQAKDKYVESVKSKYANLSIVGVMLRRRGFQLHVTITLILVAALIYLSSTSLQAIETNSYVYIILIALLVLAFFRDKLFEFRVQNGMYGNNEREAREIIRFILDNSSNIDFDNKSGPRKIIKKEDLKLIEKGLYGDRAKGYVYSNGG